MITNALIDLVFLICNILLSPISNISINIDLSYINPVIDFFKVLFYLIPIQNFIPLFTIVGVLMGIKISIAIYKLIPFKMS